ncbi:MAG: hypothetical protein JJE47_13030 [Acidimicrobiia bacterium]|nr:hypothetical protein [Acidimicrobiia bacterium]
MAEPAVEKLLQDLRDERQLRLAAESRAAAETDKARIWRQRAEQRATRIAELTEAGSGIRRLIGRKPVAQEHEPIAARSDERVRVVRKPFASFRVGCAVPDAHFRSLQATFDAVELEGGSDLDFIVVHSSRWAEAQRALERDGALTPIVAWGDDIPAELRTAARAVFDRQNPLPLTFDIRQPRYGIKVPISVRQAEIEFPPPDLIQAAADGTAVWVDVEPDETMAPLASLVAQRWAYRTYHPRLFGERILDGVGLVHHDPLPRVAMILASKRPEVVATAIRQIGTQTYRNLELRVGLHGFAMTDEIDEAIRDVPMSAEVHELSSELPLGQILNDLIDTTNAPLLAKIDDDDFYGPGHIEDSVNALEYSGCRVVGKATQFVYLEEDNATILRRPDQEGVEIAGTLNGPTLVFGREVWEQGPFPYRPRFVDVLFERAARANGYGLYATQRWEFCLMRTSSDHTYPGSSSAFLAGSDPLWPGLDVSRCVAPDNLTGLYGPQA